MRIEDSAWVEKSLADLCAKHSYDRETIDTQFLAIDSGLGLPALRKILSRLMDGHHYDLVRFFAEFLQRDYRSSYRTLGATFARKCEKAPTEPPQLLRLRDRAKAGLSCFVVKYAVNNPWLENSVTPVKCSRIFAASKEDAAERAKQHASALIPGGTVVNLRVIDILDDPEAEKADLTSISLSCEAGQVLDTAVVTSFAAAGLTLQDWRLRFKGRHPDAAATIRIEWENGGAYSFTDTLARVSARSSIGLEGVLSQDIAFVFCEFSYEDKSRAEQVRFHRELLSLGAKEHCAFIRETCLLRDRASLGPGDPRPA